MKVISTTNARRNIKTIIDRVKYRGDVYGLGRRNSIDAIIVQFPEIYNSSVNEIANINAYSKSFDFLDEEPDIYSVFDIKKNYA